MPARLYSDKITPGYYVICRASCTYTVASQNFTFYGHIITPSQILLGPIDILGPVVEETDYRFYHVQRTHPKLRPNGSQGVNNSLPTGICKKPRKSGLLSETVVSRYYHSLHLQFNRLGPAHSSCSSATMIIRGSFYSTEPTRPS